MKESGNFSVKENFPVHVVSEDGFRSSVSKLLLKIYCSVRSASGYHKPKGYIDAKETVRAAARSGKSLCEYVEEMWGIQGETVRIINELAGCGIYSNVNEVCEIGPGTGRYLEQIIHHADPTQYHIYEIDPGWRKYLVNRYPTLILEHKADGKTLCGTTNEQCELVTAFGVFVYLKPLCTFGYFKEMIRVCKPGGHIIFDCYLSEEWSLKVLDAWLASGNLYPILLTRDLILDFFKRENCTCVKEFRGRHGADQSDYFVFRKDMSENFPQISQDLEKSTIRSDAFGNKGSIAGLRH